MSKNSKRYDFTNDYERELLFKDINENIKYNTADTMVEFPRGYKEGKEANKDYREMESVRKYINSDFDDEEDIRMKELFSMATYIAAKKGYLGEDYENKSAEEIAHMVDSSLTNAKVAYKTSNGDMRKEDALEYSINRTTSRIASAADQKIRETTENKGKSIGESVGNAVGGFIGKVIGAPLGPVGAMAGGFLGGLLGGFVGDVASEVISTGVEIVSDIASGFSDFVSDGISAVGDFVSDGISAVGDFASDVFDTVTGGCYITTAVCLKDNKEDDCYELTMFRDFRDNWLIHQKDGNALIERYYKIAPQIVKNINLENDSSSIYNEINNKYLKNCLKMIENKEYEECKKLYIEMVEGLEKKYLY